MKAGLAVEGRRLFKTRKVQDGLSELMLIHGMLRHGPTFIFRGSAASSTRHTSIVGGIATVTA